MAEPDGLSIVIPCYNRAAYLSHWLAAFGAWPPPDVPVEILVIDDGGADHAEAVADRWRETGLDIRYIRLRAPGAPRNNACARNAGIRAARFSLVLNTDPDVLFATDIVRLYLDARRAGAFCSVSGYFPLTRSATSALWRASEERALRPGDLLAAARGRQNLVHSPDGVHALHGAFLCARATLLEIGGYDERFHRWGSEDRDLLTRLQQGLGLERHHVEGAEVVHQWHPKVESDGAPGRSLDLWQDGWQRACATTVAPVRRNEQSRGESRPSSAEGETGRIAEIASDPGAWPQIFAAYVYEAQVWRREGDPRQAMERLREGLSRWWEVGLARPLDRTAIRSLVASAHAAGYRNAGQAALEYARAALDAGDDAAAEEALSGAEALPGCAVDVLVVRATRAIDARRLEEALLLLEAVAQRAPTPEGIFRLIEVAVRLGRIDRARFALGLASSLPCSLADTFDRLLFDCYAAAIPDRSVAPRRWPPDVCGGAAGDFLFSIAMRARRARLFLGARAAFDAYLALEEGADEDLRGRAERLREEVSREWARLAETAAAASSAPNERES